MQKIVFFCLCLSIPISVSAANYTAMTLATFEVPEARQGIAVDEKSFYAVNNFTISQHDKVTGELTKQWSDKEKLIHLDSGMIYDGRLYAAHSNYPGFPMTSSVEVWQSESLDHMENHNFGVLLGSFTWMDRYDGFWWGAFGNYDKKPKGYSKPYGYTDNTVLVKMDNQFRVLQRWSYPKEMLDKFRPMSNSGGSWGPDGLLYLTGHDHPEVYAVSLPKEKIEMDWVGTVHTPDTAGQGIAWDRSSDERILWGIKKSTRTVVKMQVPLVLSK